MNGVRAQINPAAQIAELQALMTRQVGALRTASGLQQALRSVTLPVDLPAPRGGLDPEWIDLHDLRNMRLVAECVTRAALAREESRGAHQREDFPATSAAWQRHQEIRLASGEVRLAG
jgi:succinate dehydrogenase / fumarate reductase flavoprotein subunit/fumarate reductase (CoM/CoB) subunit A